MKLTKQGVRNLDSIGPKRIKKAIELPPDTMQLMCNHRFKFVENGDQECERCLFVIDKDENVY